MKKPNPPWFVNKRYGYGWYPATWQGWLIIGLFVLFLIFNALRLDLFSSLPVKENVTAFAVEEIIAVILLIIISCLTGEKPEWRWGEKK